MVLIAWKALSSWSTSTATNGTLLANPPFRYAAVAPPSTNHFATGRIPRWDFKRQKQQSEQKATSPPASFASVDGLHLPRHVIHQHVFAQPLRRGEVSLAAAHLRDFLHELH